MHHRHGVSFSYRYLTQHSQYDGRMTFANVGTLGVKPGKRDEVVAILTRRNPQLESAGCLMYEVGISDDDPNTVYVRRAVDLGGRASSLIEAGRGALGDRRGDASPIGRDGREPFHSHRIATARLSAKARSGRALSC